MESALISGIQRNFVEEGSVYYWVRKLVPRRDVQVLKYIGVLESLGRRFVLLYCRFIERSGPGCFLREEPRSYVEGSAFS